MKRYLWIVGILFILTGCICGMISNLGSENPIQARVGARLFCDGGQITRELTVADVGPSYYCNSGKNVTNGVLALFAFSLLTPHLIGLSLILIQVPALLKSWRDEPG